MAALGVAQNLVWDLVSTLIPVNDRNPRKLEEYLALLWS